MDLKEYLGQELTTWKHHLNEAYKTDSGNKLQEYAKGKLDAYLQVLEFLKEGEPPHPPNHEHLK
jgi:hypothetical protein